MHVHGKATGPSWYSTNTEGRAVLTAVKTVCTLGDRRQTPSIRAYILLWSPLSKDAGRKAGLELRGIDARVVVAI